MAAVAAPRTARAELGGDLPTLVLEAHVGQRPDGAERAMQLLRDQLEQHGFIADPAKVLAELDEQAPRPGILDAGRTVDQVTRMVDLGYDSFLRSKYTDAVQTLTEAIALIRRNPGLLVLDTSNAKTTFKAYVALALSQDKLQRTADSRATMVELIRMFSMQPVTKADYGPVGEEKYRSVHREVRQMSRGQLSITVSEPKAMIFVDGQIRGMGKATLGDLLPGPYQVFVQVPGSAGRQYEVSVKANEDAALDVDWEVDSSLWLTDPWVGFVFTTEADRNREAAYATALERRLSRRHVIATIGTMQLEGKPAVIGTLYDGGKVLRSAVVTSGHDEAKLRSLARFLADGTTDDALDVVKVRTVVSPVARADRRGHLAPKLLVGAGAAAIVAGGVMIAMDQDDSVELGATIRNTAPGGVAIGVSGLVAAGVGLWWWRRHGAGHSTPVITADSSHAIVGWAGRF